MTVDALLDDLIAREGGYQEDADDRGNAHGGATNYGITAQALGRWRGLGRHASRAEVKALTPDEAKEIYRAQYVAPFAAVPYGALQAQLADFAVHSGVTAAVKAFQAVVGVPRDGTLGPRTMAALLEHPWPLMHQALVAERCRFLTRIVVSDLTQRKFFVGWIRRAVSFLEDITP